MAILDIAFLPDPVLRRKAKKITVFDKELQTFIDNMIETLRNAPGVGLAAPQVSVSSRLVVVEFGEEDEEGNEIAAKKLYVVVNPEIVQASEEMENGVEGCLSIPGLVGEVERSNKIVVKGLNRFGKPVKITAEGWLARIFQHEIDHLDGIVFPDRAIRVWKPKEDEELVIND
jgi:peptide deformylase